MKSQRKEHMQQQILFEITNKLTINFFYRHYTFIETNIETHDILSSERALTQVKQRRIARHLIT